jgi:hypothetical protein
VLIEWIIRDNEQYRGALTAFGGWVAARALGWLMPPLEPDSLDLAPPVTGQRDTAGPAAFHTARFIRRIHLLLP